MVYNITTFFKDSGNRRDILGTDDLETAMIFIREAAEAGLRVVVECPVACDIEDIPYAEDRGQTLKQ